MKPAYVICAVLLFLFSACSDDDAGNLGKGTLTVEDVAYRVHDLYAQPINRETHITWDFIVVNDKASVKKSGFTSNSGSDVNYISFSVDNDPEEGIPTGTFTYEDESIFDYAVVALEYDFNTSESLLFEDNITSGTLTITKSGSEYTLTFNGMFGERLVTCSYVGKLKKLNEQGEHD